MEEFTSIIQEDLAVKTWHYSEKENKKVTHHTITVTKDRFTHQAEVKKASQEHRQRTDIRLDNVNSVNAYYGLSRNIKAVILCALFALISFVVAIAAIVDDGGAVGIVFVLIAALLVLVAVLIYKHIKPAFVLEIETYIPQCKIKNIAYAYGSADVEFGNKKHSLIFYAFLVVCFPLGIAYVLSKRNGSKYVFAMDPEVGNEIVDTVGPFLIQK